MKLLLQIFTLILVPAIAIAEGTKQVEPGLNDQAKLTIGSESALNFATYSSTDSNKIHLHIKDPVQEKIFLGFGFVFNTYAKNTRVPLYFRISGPRGNILVPSTLVPTSGAGYIASKDQALNGANGIDGVANGFDALEFAPTVAGDYTIDFSLSENPSNTPMKVYLEYFDFTIAGNDKKSIPGRIWSYLWQFNNMSVMNRANGKFFTYTQDSVVTSFVLNGMKPHGYTVMCNKYGKRPANGTPVDFNVTRQSVVIGQNDPRLNPAYAEYKIFLTDPDSLVYPSYKEPLKIKSLISISSCAAASDCQGIKIEVNKEVYAEIWIDVNNNNIKDGLDTMLLQMLVPGKNCIKWDSKDKQGKPLPPGAVIKVNAAMHSGITNFPIFDPEENDQGIRVNLIRPKYSASDDIKIYWDDRRMGVSRQSNHALANLDGCDATGTSGCHKWDNKSYMPGFGDQALMNTWWYGFTFKEVKSFTIETVPVAATSKTPALCKKEIVRIGGPPTPRATYSWIAIGGADISFLSSPSAADPEIDLSKISLKPYDSLEFERTTTLNGCTVKDTSRIIYQSQVKEIPVIGRTNVCPSIDQITISTSAIKDAYKWSVLGDVKIKGGQPQNDSITLVFDDRSAGKIKINLEASENNGCPGDTGSIIITKLPSTPLQTPQGPKLICFENNLPLRYEVPNMNHSSFRWLVPSALGNVTGPDNLHTLSVYLNSNTQGYISYTRSDTFYLSPTQAPMVCAENGDSVFVKVKGLERIKAGPDTTICAGDSAKLEIIKGSPSAIWSPSISQGAYAKPTASTQYIVKLDDRECPNADTVSVNISALHGRPFSKEKVNICFEDEDPNFELSANPGFAKYDWYPYTGAGNTISVPKNIFTDDFEVRSFGLTVQNELGCKHTDSIFVRALCPPRIFVPNAFTPNSDVENDSLNIFGAHFKNFEMKIFNRWGEIVYTTQDRYKPWDGKYKGEDAPFGVYAWTITYESLFEQDPENPRTMNGSVTLIR